MRRKLVIFELLFLTIFYFVDYLEKKKEKIFFLFCNFIIIIKILNFMHFFFLHIIYLNIIIKNHIYSTYS
jgi:hypothetical protein